MNTENLLWFGLGIVTGLGIMSLWLIFRLSVVVEDKDKIYRMKYNKFRKDKLGEQEE